MMWATSRQVMTPRREHDLFLGNSIEGRDRLGGR